MECPIPQSNELPLTGEPVGSQNIVWQGLSHWGCSIGSQFESDEPKGPLPSFCDSLTVLVTPYFSFILKVLLFFINIL